MPSKTSIAILDSALTPESPGTPAATTRTFIPGEMEGSNVHTFYETTTGTTAATRSKMTVSIAPGNGVTRVKAQIATPRSQTVDGLVKSAYVCRGFAEFILPEDASRDDRRDIRALLANLLDDPSFVTVVSDLENLY